jgi:dihydroorotase
MVRMFLLRFITIRSEEACYISSSKAVALAKKQGTFAYFHLSTAKNGFVLKNSIGTKKITAEVCIHHLWFTNDDYATKGI